MFTSNFKKHGNHPNAVAISASAPASFRGKRLLILAPTWDMISAVKLTGDAGAFEEEYRRSILSKLDPIEMFTQIQNLGSNNAILLCHENGDEFCHRRIVSEWFNETLGIIVPELNYKDDRV